MATVYVQFSDENETEVIGVFAAPQPEEYFPHQGEIDDTDPRYVAFLAKLNPTTT